MKNAKCVKMKQDVTYYSDTVYNDVIEAKQKQ